MGRAPALRRVVILLGLTFLAACANKPGGDGSNLPTSGVYKIGKPYQVNGIWYYPKEDFSYDETGIASWYGPGFHQKQTANGEIYDQNEMTAAHKTLPMPSLVRVTNLDNGRSVVVRVNDRGPFVAGRIIDMTRRGAQLLGYEDAGTAKVRVQILGDESRAIAAAARRNTPAPLLAQEEGTAPPPKAAPREKIEVAGIGGKAAPAPQPVAAPVTSEPIEDPKTVPGSDVNGRFVPSPVVADVPVRAGRRIFVQAGSFTVQENATRLSARLASVGSAGVTTATVDGKRFYRVRIGPISDVSQADAVLNRVLDTGHTDAKIVVD
jgi:rare lipoprotein A